jgi:hypothetical protein
MTYKQNVYELDDMFNNINHMVVIDIQEINFSMIGKVWFKNFFKYEMLCTI